MYQGPQSTALHCKYTNAKLEVNSFQNKSDVSRVGYLVGITS